MRKRKRNKEKAEAKEISAVLYFLGRPSTFSDQDFQFDISLFMCIGHMLNGMHIIYDSLLSRKMLMKLNI